MPQQTRPARTPPVVFDDEAWAEDMNRATDAGRMAAQAARQEFESRGAPIGELQACDPEGPGGTQLEHCVKVYVPAPAGPHGMVFEIVRDANDRLGLAYVAFGLRHPPEQSRQPAVYQVAHRRLHMSER